MKDFNIVVTRIPNSPEGLLVVPFNGDWSLVSAIPSQMLSSSFS
jgi:hypothetical protein